MAGNTNNNISQIKPVVAPNLPIASSVYSQQYTDEYSNVLRLYFNQLSSFTQSLSGSTGGALIKFPNGAFYQDGYTTLTSGISNVSTTPIPVTSTIGFLSSGTILIGTELIKYTGKTDTTFTGITRGAYGSSNASHSTAAAVGEAQTLASSTSVGILSLNNTTTSNQVSVSITDTTKVVHSISGVDNIQFSVQMLTFDGTIDNVTLWFRLNGVDIPYTAGIATIPGTHAGKPGTAIISWNLVQPLTANDYIQLCYASDTGNTVAVTYPPSTTAPVHPASPSIILTSTFVSALY